MYENYKNILQKLKEETLHRNINPIKKHGKYIDIDSNTYLNLSSNDYLGLAENRAVINGFLKNCGFSLGSASSRLLTGNSFVYHELESLLAKLYKKDRALLFNSGYHANVGIMSSLAGKKDAVFSDKLNHASIIDGIKLSEAKMFRFKHLDYDHLEKLLKEHRHEYENAIIVTESLFSMDGDFCDFSKLIKLKEEYNALLVADEAHAVGVYGQNGLGAAEAAGATSKIDLIIGTFGKAFASMGAFCAGNEILIDFLINKSRSLIFSTALPEINVAFSYYIITEVLPNMECSRAGLVKLSGDFRNLLKEYNIPVTGNSHIVPVILGSNENTMNCANKLTGCGYYLLPIRHPTVALNSSRIRISLRADINFEEIKNIPEIIKEYVDISQNDIKLAM